MGSLRLEKLGASKVLLGWVGASVLVQVVRDLDEAEIAIDDIGLRRPTLDDVFAHLTMQGAHS